MDPVFLMTPPRLDWQLKGKANFKSQSASAADASAARREWAELATAIVEAGGEVVVCPPCPTENLTGMIYTAEAGEFYWNDHKEPMFLLPNMAVPHRRLETLWIGGFIAGLGLQTQSIRSTWEAQGDVLRADGGKSAVHTFGSGAFKRTDANAYREVGALLSERHLHIQFVANPWFHGNTFLNIYRATAASGRLGSPDQRAQVVLICPDALVPGEYERLKAFLRDSEFVDITRAQSEGYDTNALQVNDTIIGSETVSEVARHAFSRVGCSFEEIALNELFSKGGGAPVCLTNRLWGADPDMFPSRVLWSQAPEIKWHTSR